MRQSFFVLGLIAAMALFVPQAVAAESVQFWFATAVQLTNVHETITSASIACNLSADGRSWFPGGESPIPIAPKCAGCPPADFIGSITVGASVPAEAMTLGVTPEQIKHYQCILKLNRLPPAAFANQPGVAYQPKPDTIFTPFVEGTIP